MSERQRRSSLRAIMHAGVRNKFESYPEPMREKLLRVREMVLEAAAETEGVEDLEEGLK